MTPVTPEARAQARFAMSLSLAAGFLMLAGKVLAYLLTSSVAILSDAAESVIHVVAVMFAAFSLWLSNRPANSRFPYGFERISLFSAGFEGALIIFAAILIVGAALDKWLTGIEIERLGAGTAITFAASVLNAGLGGYLVWVGKRTRSIIVEANGRHVLTDSWTSFGVVAGLCLVLLTGWKPFDPLLAIAVAVNILWSGSRLVWSSARGLLDYTDPATARQLIQRLDNLCQELGVAYHEVRSRGTGRAVRIEVHLLFPFDMAIGEAHRRATLLEDRLAAALDMPADIVTHLEAVEDHEHRHPGQRAHGNSA